MLYTAIPAEFISGVPVALLRAPDLTQVLELVGAAALFTALSVAIFSLGLCRYASGNLVVMRD